MTEKNNTQTHTTWRIENRGSERKTDREQQQDLMEFLNYYLLPRIY